MTLLVARRGLVGAALGVPPPPFDPIGSFNWKHAFWVDDPDWTPPGDGQPVDEWPDAVGGANLVQATESRRPTYEASTPGMCGRPGLRFNAGVGQWLDALAVEADQPDTVVIVWRHNSTSTEVPIDGLDSEQQLRANQGTSYGMEAGTIRNMTFATPAWSTPLAELADFDGADSALHINGETQQPTSSPGLSDLRELRVGATRFENVRHNGWVAFVGIRQGLMPQAQRELFTDWALSYYVPVEPTMLTQLGSVTGVDPAGTYGVEFEVRDEPLTANGLRVYSGGSFSTTLRLWRVSDEEQLGAVSLTTATDEWASGAMDPVTLEANTKYIVSADHPGSYTRYLQSMSPPLPPSGWLVTPKVQLITGRTNGTPGNFPSGSSDWWYGVADVLFET